MPRAASQRQPRLSRDERTRQTRENLLAAGSAVIGSEGYASASIARIADMARVAHGTFYNYFDDRQALFDELLPYEGARMIEAIEEAARDAAPGLARELARFRAFLDYVARNPGFYRLLYEAEIFAPLAHRRHMDTIIAGYRRSFARAMAAGHAPALTPLALDCLIHQLLGMRAYAAMQIVQSPDDAGDIIEGATAIYERMLGQLLG